MISDERLDNLANGRWPTAVSSEIEGMAKELLALRKMHEGWKLVPIDLTDEMSNALHETVNFESDEYGTMISNDEECWKALLKSVPGAE